LKLIRLRFRLHRISARRIATPRQAWLEPGHPASDYSCPNFRLHLISARQGGFWFQLKSWKSRIGDSITDGAISKAEG
jgi:hypothetical protein